MTDGLAGAYDQWLLQLAQRWRVDPSQISERPLCLFPLDPCTHAFIAANAENIADETVWNAGNGIVGSPFGTIVRLCAAYANDEGSTENECNEQLVELLQRVLSAVDVEEVTVEDLQVLLCCCAIAPPAFMQEDGFGAISNALLRILDQPPSSLVRGEASQLEKC